MTDTTERGLILGNKSADKSTSSVFKRSIAVVIGIDKYSKGIPPLSTAVNDACALAKILKKEHGYEVTLLTDEKATLARLEKEFTKKLPEKITENDRLLVYFAGHGSRQTGMTDLPVF
ncbi:Caspase domain-containing protein [Candidatus Electrothrix aarhusensis]|uniref:Caspase domain-containing protein n=1 Tax=Candidatus Electrothrix aarhusensis TaxID=1859131 RepID=A0A3S3R679_9BACT|nr:Caspase domain-containing protein [Candidatus Electrothrix aarhusensis]